MIGVTTLEKNYYGSEAAFNLSPVLTTFAEYGNSLPYSLKVSSIVNGTYSLLGTIDTNYISIGYMVNQGAKYLFNDSFSLSILVVVIMSFVRLSSQARNLHIATASLI